MKRSSLKWPVAAAVLGLAVLFFVGKKPTVTELELTAVAPTAKVRHYGHYATLPITNVQQEAAKKIIWRTVHQQIDEWSRKSGLALCWAEGTSQQRIDNFYQNAAATFPKTDITNSLRTFFGQEVGKFEPRPAWFFNAENPLAQPSVFIPTISQGSCFTLTWSFMPDGTSIAGFAGEPTSDSELIAYLDDLYGCTSTADLTQSCWFSLFTDVFDDWAEKTGVNYRYVLDDGAPITFTAPFLPDGVLGVRGDIRIGGHPIDGNSGILAYNFFPGPFGDGAGNIIQGGDMVIDVPDLFYAFNSPNPGGNFDANNSRRFRNVVSHEHGHGLGLAHSCPLNNGAKLMEPFANLIPQFDGAQEDDFNGVNSLYGDRYCNTSTGLENGLTDFASIDNASEVDEYIFNIRFRGSIAIQLVPTGTTYLAGPQGRPTLGNPSGCTPGTPYDALRQANLDMTLVDPDGKVVAMAAATGPGGTEMIQLDLATPGDYTLKVNSSTWSNVQMYQLNSTISIVPIPTMNQWGLMIFGLLIINLGVAFILEENEFLA